ncbi:hypothetical protein FO519_000774 [Halicephalobus sp. NKZ332]|nr:hypothetical protein FO519_000774 [Halicephalobus sp. NKZ332]
MEKLVSAPAKVLSVLSPSGSTKSSESISSEPDAPKEYRNLLIEMSDGKADHEMWINCFKSYEWYGDGKFSFNLDKFGVPVLKNGDYKLNLSLEYVDRYTKIDSNNRLIYWEGNYWTPTEEDSVTITVETEAILINKAANVLKKLGISRGDSVFVFCPFVIQIPIVLMATIRIGAVFSLFNATIENPEDLAHAITLANPKVIITSDCFCYGSKVINVKAILNDALAIYSRESENSPIVVMIRHGSPDPVLPPILEENRVSGKRPIYGVDIPFDSEKEFNWSNLIAGSDESCQPELMDTEDLMINTIRKREDNWTIRSYTTSQIALLAAVLKEGFGETCGTIWPLLNADNLIFVTSLFAIPHSSSSLLLFEGKLDYPNPDRFWNIVTKYKVAKLLLNIDSMRTLMEQKVHLINPNSWTMKVIFTVLNSKEDSEVASKWISTAFPNTKHVSIVY